MVVTYNTSQSVSKAVAVYTCQCQWFCK